MKTWTIAAQKGGVGKTTTAVNLAGALVRRGERVLMLDLDPHGSLTAYFGFDADSLDNSSYALFEAAINEASQAVPPLLLETGVSDLTLLGSSTGLVTLERRYGQRAGLGLVIKRALLSVATSFDYCLIDCPPTLGMLVVNALVAADHLIIPVQTEYLSAQTLDRMVATSTMIERSRGSALPYTVVPTMYDRRTRAGIETLRALRARTDLCLWDSLIPVDTLFRDASQLGKPLTLLQPYSRGSTAYHHLAEFLTEDGALHQRAAG